MPTTPAIYPMIFSFTEHVSGRGFLAAVTGCGRALMAQEDDGAWWMYGVEPGGLAESGETPQEAHLRFIAALRAVLTDVAADCRSVSEFGETIKGLFHQVSRPDEAVWSERAQAIRSN